MTGGADLDREAAEAAAAVRTRVSSTAQIGVILGSGLGALTQGMDDTVVIPVDEIPNYPVSTVQGHAGELVFGSISGRRVWTVRGRVHMYEGHDARTAAFPVRLLARLGVRKLIVTNAAGGISPELVPGTLMLIEDHINFAAANPLVGANIGGGPRFPDMSSPYDPQLLRVAEQVGSRLGLDVVRGVYLWTIGPSYETRAEIRAFATLGADAVGMSTVPEVIQAVYSGMSVLGVSTITNPAAGLSATPLAHDEVIAVGERVSSAMLAFLAALVAEIGDQG